MIHWICWIHRRSFRENSIVSLLFSFIIAFHVFCYCLQMKFVKVMFWHVSVCPQGGVPGQVPPPPWSGTLPWTGTPPLGRHPPGQVPPWQVHPPWAGTLHWQVHPWAGTPPVARYIPLGRYTLLASTSLGRYIPRSQVHPPWAGNPPPEQCMLGYTGNEWAVRILLECSLVLCNSGIN